MAIRIHSASPPIHGNPSSRPCPNRGRHARSSLPSPLRPLAAVQTALDPRISTDFGVAAIVVKHLRIAEPLLRLLRGSERICFRAISPRPPLLLLSRRRTCARPSLRDFYLTIWTDRPFSLQHVYNSDQCCQPYGFAEFWQPRQQQSARRAYEFTIALLCCSRFRRRLH